MKALSIKNPWADLIASGKKTIETRRWRTKYRGKVLLCVSKKPVTENSGLAIAIADIIDCKPMKKSDKKAACIEKYDGAFSWFLDNVVKIKPIPVKGMLGLFEAPHNIETLELL
jgi:hypothetical protein